MIYCAGMISEDDERVLINYILDENRVTTTSNAAIVLKNVTFTMLLEEKREYFKYMSDSNNGDFKPSFAEYFNNEFLTNSVRDHFGGIDKFVDEYYNTLKNKLPTMFRQTQMDKTQTEELIRRFEPLLYSYYNIFQANKKDFLPNVKTDPIIAVYAFTKIVHFNLDSGDIEDSEDSEGFFKNLPYDRFIIYRMGRDGVLKLSLKNLLISKDLGNWRFGDAPNIILGFERIRERDFPDDSNGKTVALIAAPGYTDTKYKYEECSSWRLSEVLQVLRDGEGFKKLFFFRRKPNEKDRRS